MAANAVVRARIDERVKREAAAVLADLGLTVSDAVRILLTAVARDRAFPIELTPNARTASALRKSARGEDVHRAEDAEDLFKQLGI